MFQSLILFWFFSGCSNSSHNPTVISIDWTDSIPTGLVIPRQLIPSLSEHSIGDVLQVHLADDSSPEPVMGNYIFSIRDITFKPLIPFTSELTYEVTFKGKSLQRIKIPCRQSFARPQVVGIYPTQDTVPENLLKIYIHFSKPMREVNPLEYVRLLENEKDTLENVFLDMRPALWDRDGVLLTLWLDPGRIKRDLQPNQRSGPPIVKGKQYKLLIKNHWPAKDGATLTEPFSKTFFTGERDNTSPDPSRWHVSAPRAGTMDPLLIQLDEVLDFVLLNETFYVMNDKSRKLDGRFLVEKGERNVSFFPSVAWQQGVYTVNCESRLEDMAGNNLNRVFDQDLTITSNTVQREYSSLDFTVH